MNVAPFMIRSAQDADVPYLLLLLRGENMPLMPDSDLLTSSVAVNDDDKPVGFIRILQVSDAQNPQASAAYVYPVAVFPEWRDLGVGRALISHAQKKYGELRLVACRASRAFYPKCGFQPISWKQIAASIARDCELCPDLPTCDPQPFAIRT